VAYWLVFLVFLPLVVNALGLSLGTGPVADMIGLFLAFIPKLVAAGAILALGWFAATIVRRLVTAAVAGLGLDRLSTRVGLARTLGPDGLSGLVGLLAYILVLIPAVIGALEALGLTALTVSLTALLTQFLAVIPLLFFAAVVLAVSYVVARLVADLATALLAAIGVDALPARLGLSRVVPAEGSPLSRLVGELILLVIMTLATIEAARLLNFEAVATLLGAFLVLLGQVLLGLLVLAVGLYLADVLAGVVAASGVRRADLLATITRGAVIALAVPMALKQIGLGDEIVVLAFGLLLGGAVLGLAVAVGVAFGIGGRGAAEDLVTEWRGQLPRAEPADPSLPAGAIPTPTDPPTGRPATSTDPA
jgi:Mechanosensitive ion channel, conserved TM helix